jgi:hypothetical protein
MDDPLQTDQPKPEETSIEGSAPDYATRRIEPDELFAALEKEAPPAPDAATVILTQADDPAATESVPEIMAAASPARMTVDLPAPAVPAQPGSPPPPAAPKKENRTSMAVIIAIAAVALVCICSCTIVVITTLLMIPYF